MMTRETKAGLVVSCSFLCLLGTVVVHKLRNTEPNVETVVGANAATPPSIMGEGGKPLYGAGGANDGKNSATSSEQPNAAADGKVAPATFQNIEDAKLLTGGQSGAAKSNETAGAIIGGNNPARGQGSVNAGNPSTAQAKAATGAMIEDDLQASDPLGKTKPPIQVKPAVKPPAGSNVATAPKPEPKPGLFHGMIDHFKKKDSAQAKAQQEKDPKSSNELIWGQKPANQAGTVKNPVKPKLELASDPLADLDTGGKPSSVNSGDKAGNNPQPTIQFPDPPPSTGFVNRSGEKAGGEKLPAWDARPAKDADKLPAFAGNAGTAQNSSGSPRLKSAPLPGRETPSWDTAASGNNGVGGSQGRPPTGSSINPNYASNQDRFPAGTANNSFGNADRGSPLITPAITAPGRSQVVQGVTPGERNGSTRAPIGAPITATTPRLDVPGFSTTGQRKNAPVVESYDEETVTVRANDSFRSLSAEFYQNPRYEKALQLFNRSHPLAPEAMRQNSTALRPGQSVFMPPKEILEKYYAAAIQEAEQLAARGTGGVAVTPAARLSAEPVLTGNEKSYRVRGNDEMVYDIAKRTLGDGLRWVEIQRLNQNLDPRNPVPAGTELRLPANAKVDSVE